MPGERDGALDKHSTRRPTYPQPLVVAISHTHTHTHTFFRLGLQFVDRVGRGLRVGRCVNTAKREATIRWGV